MKLTERQWDVCIGVAVVFISFILQRYVSFLFAYGFSDKYGDVALVFIWLFAIIYLGAIICWWREEKSNKKFAAFAIIQIVTVAVFLLLLAAFVAVLPALFVLVVVTIGGCAFAIKKFGIDKLYFAKISLFAAIALSVNTSTAYYCLSYGEDVSYREEWSYEGYGLIDNYYTIGGRKLGIANKFGNIIVPVEYSGVAFCQSRDGSNVIFVAVNKKNDLGQECGLIFTVFNNSGKPIDKFAVEFEKDSEKKNSEAINEIKSIIEMKVGIIASGRHSLNLYDLVSDGFSLKWDKSIAPTKDTEESSEKKNDETTNADSYKEEVREPQHHEETHQGHTPERHETKVPVQEWKQCNNCFGSGQCGFCNGQGEIPTFNGPIDCKVCIGGKCATCAGTGGHYETEYRTRVDYY